MSLRRSKSLYYLFILFGSLLLLFIQTDFSVSLKQTFYNLASLPLRIVASPIHEVKKIFTYHKTYDDYYSIKQEVVMLKARLIGFEEVLRENNRLEQLLNFKRKLIFSSIAANVIGRDPSNWNATIVIDKGLKNGIVMGMPVVSSLGVVGKIAEVTENKSKVILLSDPSFSVAALDQRSREVGLVSGTLQGMCRMRYLSAEADILVGDYIITSKLSSSFPEGLVVGQVMEIHSHKKNMTIDCIVRPAVSLSQIEEVLVIQNK